MYLVWSTILKTTSLRSCGPPTESVREVTAPILQRDREYDCRREETSRVQQLRTTGDTHSHNSQTFLPLLHLKNNGVVWCGLSTLLSGKTRSVPVCLLVTEQTVAIINRKLLGITNHIVSHNVIPSLPTFRHELVTRHCTIDSLHTQTTTLC